MVQILLVSDKMQKINDKKMDIFLNNLHLESHFPHTRDSLVLLISITIMITITITTTSVK